MNIWIDLNLTPRFAVYLCIQDGRVLDEDVHVYTQLVLIVANIQFFLEPVAR